MFEFWFQIPSKTYTAPFGATYAYELGFYYRFISILSSYSFCFQHTNFFAHPAICILRVYQYFVRHPQGSPPDGAI